MPGTTTWKTSTVSFKVLNMIPENLISWPLFIWLWETVNTSPYSLLHAIHGCVHMKKHRLLSEPFLWKMKTFWTLWPSYKSYSKALTALVFIYIYVFYFCFPGWGKNLNSTIWSCSDRGLLFCFFSVPSSRILNVLFTFLMAPEHDIKILL